MSDVDDEVEYWLSQKREKAMKKSDKVKFTFGEGGSLKNMTSEGPLDIKAVRQILNGEIDFYETRGKGISGRSQDYEDGWLAALLDFRRTLLRSEYAMKNTLPKPTGYMGDIGGTPYGPSDRDADYLGECTCGMGAGTIASEEHAESCPMSAPPTEAN